MIHLDVLIFDIDGVLIDVAASYRDAVRQTAQLYLQDVMGLPPCAGDLVSREEVAAFKLAGGFNSDWDLTAGILRYFLAMLQTAEVGKTSAVLDRATTRDIVTFLRREGEKIGASVETLRRRKDLRAFADALCANGGGLAATRQILGDRNAHLLFAEGDVRGANLVKRIFEEVYLGEELFRVEYGDAPLIHRGDGLIHRERLIPNLQSLIFLSQRVALGIATGRPRRQALYALERFGIRDVFRALVTLEDIVAVEQQLRGQPGRSGRAARSTSESLLAMPEDEVLGQQISLGKPHPFALLEAARRIAPKRVRCAYVGDTPDDVRAARAANAEMDFIAIGCLAGAEDKDALRREFERVGAEVIVEHPDELTDLLEP